MMLLLGIVGERDQTGGFLPVGIQDLGRVLGGWVDPKEAFGPWET